MRLAATALLTLAGLFVAQTYTITYYLTLVICAGVFIATTVLSYRNPRVASLRHVAIASAAMTVVAGITVVLLVTAPNGVSQLDPTTRLAMRNISLAAVVAPSLYWLILLVTGGFDER